MTYSNISSLNLGSILQILFSKGVTTQISRDYSDYDNILFSMKKDNAIEREYRYYLLKALGPSAVLWQNPGTTNRAFPSGQQVSSQEVTAKMKEIQTTIELEQNLWDRAMQTPLKYAEPLQVEIQAKIDMSKRQLAKDLYNDGTGVLGAVSAITNSGALAKVTLKTGDTDPGFVGWFEPGDLVEFYAADGSTEHVPSASDGTVTYAAVDSIDRVNNYVYLTCYSSGDVALTCSGAGSVVNTDFLYRKVQLTRPNRGSVSDWGVATEAMAGLESLTATDGRTLFGVTMSGVTGGTRYSNAAAAIDTDAFEAILNNVKIKKGKGKYNWNQALMAFETQTSLINAREADRRFITVDDTTRGAKYWAYQHRDSTVKCLDSEFCPKNRIYFLPSPKVGEMGESGYAIEFRGTPFEAVKVGSQEQFLKPASGGGYVGMVQQFMRAYGVLVAKDSPAVGVIHNFV